METVNNLSADTHDSKSPIHSNSYNNELSSGTIGAEGGNDNGASAPRALKKKRAEKPSGKSNLKSML